MKKEDLIKVIGIFLLVLLGLIIINVGVVLICIFVPTLSWIILGGALIGFFIIIYHLFERFKGEKKC
jgi:hypothetical protein